MTEYVHLWVVPVELAEANAFISKHHRHHAPVIGHRFSVGAVDDAGQLRAVAVIGRPVARLAGHPRSVIEVARLASDGTPNACSILYAAAARAAKALGFERIQTYILAEELGTTLKASGWTSQGEAGGGQWVHTDGRPRRSDQPTGMKERWVLQLNPTRPSVIATDAPEEEQGTPLFGEDHPHD